MKYAMILEYINAALEHASYEIIEDDEPYYGEIPELPGVFATGRTLEECRRNLAGVIDEWLIIRLRRGLPISHKFLCDDVLRRSPPVLPEHYSGRVHRVSLKAAGAVIFLAET